MWSVCSIHGTGGGLDGLQAALHSTVCGIEIVYSLAW